MGFWADLPWSKEVQRLKEMHAEEQRKNKFLKDLNRELIADLEITKDDLRRSEKSESILRSMKIQLEDELSEKTFRLTQAERELTSRTHGPSNKQIQDHVEHLIKERAHSLRRKRSSTDTLHAPPTSKRPKASPAV